MAARAVGDALGVSVRPAAPSEHPATLRDPLEAIARASHLRLRRVRLSDYWWQHDSGPLLAYTREGQRPVALLPTAATRYVLFDPQQRTHTPVQARLAAILAPLAYTFYRPFPQRALRWFDLLSFGLRGGGKDLLLVLLSGLAVTLLGMLAPHTTAILIDTAIPDADRRMVLELGAALLAAAFGQTLLQLAQGCALLRQHTTAGAALQAALWDRLLALPMAFFRQYASGDLQTRAMAINTMQQHLSGSTLRTLCTGSLALLNLGLLFFYSPPLALVALAVALVVGLATLLAGLLSVRQERALQHLKGALLGLTVQLITGVSKLRVAGAEARAFAVWGQLFRQQQEARQRLQGIADTLTVLNAVLPTVAAVGLFWGAMRLFENATDSGLTAGTFVAFHAAFGLFLSGVTSLSTTLIDVLEVATLWERARPIVQATPEVRIGQSDPGRLTGTLALEQVTFRYREHSPVILDKVSLHAAPGEFIALVGPSGSGKSTVFRLLLGFETPEAGVLYYDGQELSRLDITAVRRQIGSVLQHSTLMAGTIFEHIAGNARITHEDAWEAVHAAGLAEDLAALPMGLHTFVSEGGSNLSGGQRQRLLIARALVGKPAIVLFDEATSALDNRTQAVVTASLERLRVTRVVIAHRLSTIRSADRIYVLDGGRVVQQGTFAELARRPGLFAQLMARQQSAAATHQSFTTPAAMTR
jgi:NHLM bacteriocin system ABC transporter ATP-binding protein